MGSASPYPDGEIVADVGYILRDGLHDYCVKVAHIGEQMYCFARDLLERTIKRSGHSLDSRLELSQLREAVNHGANNGVSQGVPSTAIQVLEGILAHPEYMARQAIPARNNGRTHPLTH